MPTDHGTAESGEVDDDHNPEPGEPSPRPSRRRGSRFPPAARWTLVFFVVVIALVVAIWPRGDSTTGGAAEQVRPRCLPG